MILATFELDAVRLEVSCGTAVVACSLIVPGGVCITIVHVIFSVFSLSAWFGGIGVQVAVCAFVLLLSVSLSASSSPTLSATLSVMSVAMISAKAA